MNSEHSLNKTKIKSPALQWKMDSKLGPLYLVASEQGLRGIFWKKQNVPMARDLNSSQKPVKCLAQTLKQLSEYLENKRRKFDLPLDMQGTEFQKRVWEELARIPYGDTCSYRDIARKIKNEKAVRAVGTANGRNPLCIIVPCHRVIASDGTLGGYSGGIALKTKLLTLEQQTKRRLNMPVGI